MKIRYTPYSNIVALLCNVLLAFVVYMICRVAYVWENWNIFSNGWESLRLWNLVKGGLRFDASAIAYTNWLWAILLLLPIAEKRRTENGERKTKNVKQKICKWIFVVVNSLTVAINLSDAVYSQYTGRRTTATFFDEFSNDDNLGTIFFTEVLNHWYLVLLALALIAALWFLYTEVHGTQATLLAANQNENHNESHAESAENGNGNGNHPDILKRKASNVKRKTILVNSIALLLLIPITVFTIRGGLPHKVLKPIALSDANRYVNQPHETAIVLNTPFTLIRTIGKTTFVDPHYFDNDQLAAIYSPVHQSALEESPLSVTPHGSVVHNSPSYRDALGESIPTARRNVVILIVESFGREYIGFYNNNSKFTIHNSQFKSYTPFVDSLLEHSLTWEQTYANGRKSIDAMPSILSSIPMFVEPFFVTSYSLNRIGGLAYELGRVGYSSAFFHGASNGSMGFENFARASKFQHYYGRNEYDDDPRFGGENDFDGTWAIWDEPFLQYYATKMSEMQEPFVTAVFTASSHHPFNIPDKYRNIYKEEELPIHKCIRYTDNALREFFATAVKQPWFKNTIFVLTSDHTNMSNHDEYQTAMGLFSAPIFIYDPSGELPTGIVPGIAQQIDIMPTILGLLGYPNPYIAFGKDLLTENRDILSAPQACDHSGANISYLLRRPATAVEQTYHQSWAVNYNNGVYQYLEGDTLVQFDGQKVLHIFDMRNDPMLRNPLNTPPKHHVDRLKAIIQQYMHRMINDDLVIKNQP